MKIHGENRQSALGFGFLAALALFLSGSGGASAAPRFEVAAWVDHYDFAAVREGDRFLFDTETAAGDAALLAHVRETGATTILWRNCGGATMRYPSRADARQHEAMPDKRRIPCNDPVYGWVRYGDARPDLLADALGQCRAAGLTAGVHWPFEETHWAGWTIGGYNLEHPQYWGRVPGGAPWWGRGSLGYPEVVRHKLALVDELAQRGMQVLFIDFYRTGGWSPAYEYVPPVMQSYRKQYGAEPPADPRDPRWCRHVSTYVTAYLRQVRRHLDASGRKIKLYVGVPQIAPLGDQNLIAAGMDWQQWVREGLIDTLVIEYVRWDPKDPMGSTRALCREVMREVNGRCRVLWPVCAYNYSNYGMPSYCKALGVTQQEAATRLMEMAWEEGADGISLECVDYNNYTPATRQAMRALAEGKCRWVREGAAKYSRR